MKKKLLSVLLSTAMVASLLVGCGSSSEEAAPAETETTEETTEEVSEETTETEVVEDSGEVTEAAVMEAPSTDGWDDSMKINRGVQIRIEKIIKAHVGGSYHGSITKTRWRVSNKTDSFLLGSRLFRIYVWRENRNRKQHDSGVHTRNALCSRQ